MSNSIRLRELIRLIRNAKTQEEERSIIARECAAIRNSLKEKNPYRARNVAKLMYIHMMGYDTTFGQMECINLIVSSKYPEKRIGYLAVMILLDEKQEVLTLVQHSLAKDMVDKNQFVQSLALTAMANIANEDICRDLSMEVEKLLFHSPYIRKKAALVAVRVINKCPEKIDNYIEKIEPLLLEKNHGVLLATVTLMAEIVKKSKKFKVQFRKHIPQLLKILKNLQLSAYSMEHDIGGVSDPFLQTKLLKMLRMLGKGSTKASEAMSETLAHVATNIEGGKNASNAVLYECVRTILDIQAEASLRTLAINQLGKFLNSKENNLRYVSLQMLTKVVLENSNEQQNVNRHLQTIVECMKDPDLTIRMKALELISVLINESNVKYLVNELVGYLQLTPDGEFKQDLTTKICLALEKFGPSHDWQILTLLRVITLAGQYVRENTANYFIGLCSLTRELQEKVVTTMYQAVCSVIQREHLLDKQELLLNVGIWCVGEYSSLLIKQQQQEEEVLKFLFNFIRNPHLSTMTKALGITCLTKFSQRFSKYAEKISAFISKFRDNFELELQQRAVEFTALFKWDKIRDKILEEMPSINPDVLDRTVEKEEQQQQHQTNGESQENTTAITTEEHPTREMPHAKIHAAPTQNLLEDMLLPMESTPNTNGTSQNNGGFSLENILSAASSTATTAPVPSNNTNKNLLDLFDMITSTPNPPISSISSVPPVSTTPMNRPTSTISSPSAIGSVASPIKSVSSPAQNLESILYGGDILSTPTHGNGNLPAPLLPENKLGEFIRVFDQDQFGIDFELRKPDLLNNPGLTDITAHFSNKSATPLVQFDFQLAVPKYLKLQMMPPSSDEIPALSEKRVQQKIRVTNSLQGQKGLLFKFKLLYKKKDSGEMVEKVGEISKLPAQY